MKLVAISCLILLSSLSLSLSDSMWVITQILILTALLNFLNPWNHILLNLLNLELISLLLIGGFSLFSLGVLSPEFFFSFFTLAVCEASLGLAILIFFSHSKGSESLSSLLSV